MVKFPETIIKDWTDASSSIEAAADLRKRIERGTAVEAAVERLRINHEAKEQFRKELEEENADVLEMTSLGDYKTNPTVIPSDLIEGVARDNGVTAVVGPSGSGKTTTALQMVHSLLTGDDWLGSPTTKLAGTAGIMSYDMDGSMILDWMSHAPNLPDDISVVNAYGKSNPLLVERQRATIASHWRSINVDVVLIDSFSASFTGKDQNDTADVTAHYKDLQKFALTEVGARALIVIVHSSPSSPRKPRGSTAHYDVPDTRVVVVPEENDGPREVSVDKYRDLPGTGITKKTPVIITAPDPMTHLVDVDIAEMGMKGLSIPQGVADRFTDDPEPVEAPDTGIDPEFEFDEEEEEK